MDQGESLYFLAIKPDQRICDEIDEFKRDFAQRFNSSKALKVFPHITLKAPFKLSGDRHDELLNWFQNLKYNSGPFKVQLKNFGAFYNKYKPVIYVNPIMSIPLFLLQKEIIKSFRLHFPEQGVHNLELKFKPHITVAYRDLDPGIFPAAWKLYRTKIYEADFSVDGFFLLQHDRVKWHIIETFNLKNSGEDSLN